MWEAGMSNRVLLEVCVDRLEDALLAKIAGADRIELCGALELGGLTPSIGLIKEVIAATGPDVVVMVRPRAGGFDYDDDELRVAWRDAECALAAGAAGLVFGCLYPDGEVNTAACRTLVRLAGDKTTVFHRAFDFVPDVQVALDELIGCGMTRILTSGRQPTALAGAALIKQLVATAAGRIEVLPGGGVTADQAAKLLTATGCTQLHMSGSKIESDHSLQRNASLATRDTREFDAGQYRRVDGTRVARVRKEIDGRTVNE
jgi:copper homeostasis protein